MGHGVGGRKGAELRVRPPKRCVLAGDEQLGQWLRERWVEKDKLLSAFARNGASPRPAVKKLPPW